MGALRRLNPEASLHDSVRAAVPLDNVLGTTSLAVLPSGPKASSAPSKEPQEVRTFVYRRRRPFHPARLAGLLRDPGALPPSLLRAKGSVWIATRPAEAGEISFV